MSSIPGVATSSLAHRATNDRGNNNDDYHYYYNSDDKAVHIQPEGNISDRVQYTNETVVRARKVEYKEVFFLPEVLDLVLEEKQITHGIQLKEDSKVEDSPNFFEFDPNYIYHYNNETEYNEIVIERLGKSSFDDDKAVSVKEESKVIELVNMDIP